MLSSQGGFRLELKLSLAFNGGGKGFLCYEVDFFHEIMGFSPLAEWKIGWFFV